VCPLCKSVFKTASLDTTVKVFEEPSQDADADTDADQDEEEEDEGSEEKSAEGYVHNQDDYDLGYEYDDFVVPDSVLEYDETPERDVDQEIRKENRKRARARRRERILLLEERFDSQDYSQEEHEKVESNMGSSSFFPVLDSGSSSLAPAGDLFKKFAYDA
jgi:hypothetical protein